MANLILLVGGEGTGKSTSIKNLKPEETAIINVLGKPLPFKGSSKMYNGEARNYKELIRSDDIVAALHGLSGNPSIKTVILDDIGFSMLDEFFERGHEIGYEKFAIMGRNMQLIIANARQMPADKTVVLMFHEDTDDTGKKLKVKLIGQMLDDKYNPLGNTAVCLFTEVTFDKEKKPVYQFITNRTLSKYNVEIPAKSPQGMFDDLRIPNDLEFVIKKVKEYYE